MEFLGSLSVTLEDIQQRKAGRATGFCIGTTRKSEGLDYFFTPTRESPEAIVGSVVVASVETAGLLAEALDGRVDYLFVDVENKISSDSGEGISIEAPVRKLLRHSKFLPYKSNDLTVDAIEKAITAWFSLHKRSMEGTSIAIIGCGNIGSKLALRMVEMGVEARLYRRSTGALETVAAGINAIKSAETNANAISFSDPLQAAENADIVIGLAPGVPVVGSETIKRMKKDGLIIDGGKGCITAEAIQLARERGITTLRADIRAAFSGLVTSLLAAERMFAHGLKIRQMGQHTVVSAGLLALVGEIIVLDTDSPTRIIGIADGTGELHRFLSAEQQRILDEVAKGLTDNPAGQ